MVQRSLMNGVLRLNIFVDDVYILVKSIQYLDSICQTTGFRDVIAQGFCTNQYSWISGWKWLYKYNKWQGGFAFVANSPTFQLGSLISWQASFAGDDTREKTSLGAFQPFYFWQWGKGTYIPGAPVWVFDFRSGNYNTPIALGIGKVIKVNKTVFNLFVEPQYSVLSSGTQPQVKLLRKYLTLKEVSGNLLRTKADSYEESLPVICPNAFFSFSVSQWLFTGSGSYCNN